VVHAQPSRDLEGKWSICYWTSGTLNSIVKCSTACQTMWSLLEACAEVTWGCSCVCNPRDCIGNRIHTYTFVVAYTIPLTLVIDWFGTVKATRECIRQAPIQSWEHRNITTAIYLVALLVLIQCSRELNRRGISCHVLLVSQSWRTSKGMSTGQCWPICIILLSWLDKWRCARNDDDNMRCRGKIVYPNLWLICRVDWSRSWSMNSAP